MNTPVSFPLAKLLKEKGFNIPTNKYYYNEGKDFFESNRGKYNHNDGLYTSAPTVSEVVMWLYGKHGIWIYVVKSNNSSKFFWRLRGEEKPWETPSNGRFDSPTEAYEAAIEYVLNNLI